MLKIKFIFKERNYWFNKLYEKAHSQIPFHFTVIFRIYVLQSFAEGVNKKQTLLLLILKSFNSYEAFWRIGVDIN